MSREEVEEFFSEDLGFRLSTPKLGVSLFDQPIDFESRAASNFPLQLLDVGHKTQVYAAANSEFVGVGKLDDLDDSDPATIRKKFAAVAICDVTSVRFNATNEQLYILSNGSPQKAEVSELYSRSSAEPFTPISPKTDVTVLEPSPSQASSYAFLDSSKTLFITQNGSTAEIPGVDAFAWTYNGTEIVIVRGTNLEFLALSGGVTQTASFELEEAGRIFSVSSIDPANWYIVGRPEDDDEIYTYTLVTKTGGAFTAKELLLPPPVNESPRQPTTYFSSMREWMAGSALAFLASGLSAEICTLECGANTRLVFQSIDTDRAELPMDEDSGDDTLPVGFALDLSGTYRTVKNVSPLIEEAEGVLPRILCLNNVGNLFVWNVFDVAGVREKTLDLRRAIENLPAVDSSSGSTIPKNIGTEKAAQNSTLSPPLSASSPGFGQTSTGNNHNPSFPPAKPAASGFGATGFGASGFGKSQNAGSPMFGANDFKSSSQASPKESSAKPAFGSAGFGQSTSGNSSGFGASGFGNIASSSTGAGSNANANSGFGTFGSGAGATSGNPVAFGQTSFGTQKSGGAFGGSASGSGTVPDNSKSAFGSNIKFGASTGGSGNASSPFASLSNNSTKSSPFGSLSGNDAKSSPFASLGSTDAKASPFGSLATDQAKSSPFSNLTGKDDKSSPFSSFASKDEKSSPFSSLMKDEKKSLFEGSSSANLPESKPSMSSPFASLMPNAKPSPLSFSNSGEKKSEPFGAKNGFGNKLFADSSRVEAGSDSESELVSEPYSESGSDQESETQSGASEDLDDLADSSPKNKNSLFSKPQLFSNLTLGGKASEKPKNESGSLASELPKPRLGGSQFSSATKDFSSAPELSASSNTPSVPLNSFGGMSVKSTSPSSGFFKSEATGKETANAEQAQNAVANGKIAGSAATAVQGEKEEDAAKKAEKELYENKDIAQVIKELEYLKFGGFSDPHVRTKDELAFRFNELLQLTNGRMDILSQNSEKSNKLIKAAGVHRKTLQTSDLEDSAAWTLGNLADLAETAKIPRETLDDILTSLKHQDSQLSKLLEGEDAAGRKKAELEKILAQLALYKQSMDSPDLTKRPLDARGQIMRQKLRKKLAYVEKLQEDVSQKLLPLGVHLGLGETYAAKVEKLQKLVRELSIRARILMQEAVSLEEQVHGCCATESSSDAEDSEVQLLLGYPEPSGPDRIKLAEKFARGSQPRKIQPTVL